jgi:hypothetical protein
MYKYASVINNKSIHKKVCRKIILIARLSVCNYNSNKMLRFLRGGY